MSPDERSRTRTIDPARQARDQARAGLPVTVCPFCGGPANDGCAIGSYPLCCCGACWADEDRMLARRLAPYQAGHGSMCAECPHRPSGDT